MGGLYAALKHVSSPNFHPKPCPHIPANVITHAGSNGVIQCFGNTAVATAAPYIVDAAVGALAGLAVGMCIVMFVRILQRARSR
jgi:hypothetical protein